MAYELNDVINTFITRLQTTVPAGGAGVQFNVVLSGENATTAEFNKLAASTTGSLYIINPYTHKYKDRIHSWTSKTVGVNQVTLNNCVRDEGAALSINDVVKSSIGEVEMQDIEDNLNANLTILEEINPSTGTLRASGTAPEIFIRNTTAEDTDEGRESTIRFKGIQSGAEETTLALIKASHNGAADDEKGQLQIFTNDGADGNTPTLVATITENQFIGIGTDSPSGILHTTVSAFANTPILESTTGAPDEVSTSLKLSQVTSVDATGEAGPEIRFQFTDTGISNAKLASISGVRNGADNKGALIFATNDEGSLNNQMRIQYDGKVGIGASSPAAKLEIEIENNNNPGYGLLVDNNDATNDPDCIAVENITVGADTSINGLKSKGKSVSFNDDASVDLPDATNGWGYVMAGDNEEFARFRWTTAGVVTLDEQTANVNNTGADTDLCIYNAVGTQVSIKNRLGAPKVVKYLVHYS